MFKYLSIAYIETHKSVHYNDLIFKYFKHILLSYKTKQMNKTQVVNL